LELSILILFLNQLITTNEGIGLDKRQLVVVAQSFDPHVSNLSELNYLKKRDLLFTQQVPLFLRSFNTDFLQMLRAVFALVPYRRCAQRLYNNTL
jgi:hypothetical protein